MSSSVAAARTNTTARAQAAQRPTPGHGRQAPRPSVGRELGALALKIALITLVAGLLFSFVYGFQRNLEPGMDPAVKDGDLALFYRLDKSYAIGDLLLFTYRGESQIRRIVARAGDVVDITDSGLVVNGALQQEPNIYQKTQRYEDGIAFPVTVGAGQVFVLGDARENATDSRVYGPVTLKDTAGTVITTIRRRNL